MQWTCTELKRQEVKLASINTIRLRIFMSKAKYRFFLRQDESTNENVFWFLVNQLKIKAVIDIKI